MRMKLLTVPAALYLILCVCGCGGGSGGTAERTSSGRTIVTINLGQSKSAAGRSTQSIPPDVALIRVRVTAPDMVAQEMSEAIAGKTTLALAMDVPNGKNRLFRVEAADGNGSVRYVGQTYADLEGEPVSLAIVMISSDPAAPAFGGISGITGITTTSLVLSWQPAADDVTPAARIHYLIYLATSPGGEDFGQQSFTSEPGQTTYTVTGLSPRTQYFFVVRAVDERGNSDTNTVEMSAFTASPPDSQAPSFKGIASVTGLPTGELGLSWIAASDNFTPPSGMVYLIYMATAPGKENLASPSFTTAAGAVSFTVKGLTPGATYYFIVRARDEAGNIDQNVVEKSAFLSDTVPPVFGGITSATAFTSSSGGLTWNAATDNLTPQGSMRYCVYMATKPGGEDFSVPTYTSAFGATSITVESLQPLTTYYFVVRAKDQAGNTDTNKVEMSFTTPPSADTVPPVFGGLASVTVSVTTLSLNWSPATDNVGLSGYAIYAATTPGGQNFSVPTMTAAAGATSAVFSAPNGATTYYFVVRAQDVSGNMDANTVERSATTDAVVNAATGNDTTGTGIGTAPFRTITRAVAASATKPGITIHVASGTHDAALGEVFPVSFGTAGRTLNCTAGGTVISAGGLAIQGSTGTTINNCTINGRVNDSGGATTIANCVIDGASFGGTGAGIALGYNSTVTNSLVRNFIATGPIGIGIDIGCVATCTATSVTGSTIGNNNQAMNITNSSPTISGNLIANNVAGISVFNNAGPTITGNSIYGNGGNGLTFSLPSASTVSGNTICGNNNIGINVNDATAGAAPVINNNRIYQNTNADLRAWSSSFQINATNNFWDNNPPSYGAGVCTGGVDTCSASFPAAVLPSAGLVGGAACP